jgi:hypothetical protein
MAAAAIAPLLMISFQAAYAQTTISSNTSTPADTASSGDLTLGSSSTFTITSSTPALTLNSNNVLNNEGTITSNNVDNVTGMLIKGGYSGTVTNGVAINLTESYAPGSLNNNGIADAPFAQGTNRIGILMSGPFTGSIYDTGSVTIQGNNSTGISLQGALNGSLEHSGSITVTGDNSFGIKTNGEITGEMRLTGTVSVKGQNSVGVQINGPIDGAFRLYSTITSTGYAVSVRETGPMLTQVETTPGDVQQGGSALQIFGSVKGGVFLGAPPPGTVPTDTTTDADADGIVDSAEGTSSITTYGSAPALQIGGPTAITFGNFGSSFNAYGLIIEGTISAQGLMDGVSSTAVDIGVGHSGVNLSGGIRVAGTVSSASFQADSMAIHLENGVTGAALLNTGTISATVTSGAANTATALQIDAGATLNSITNTGILTAIVNGDTANALAVVDKSGAVNSVLNYDNISAVLNPAIAGEAVTGQGIALDLRANTSGVTFTQLQAPGSTVVPTLVGDVLLGSGPNTVSLLAGSMQGTLSMGSAPGSLTIDNGAAYVGNLIYGGNHLAINIANGSLQDTSATTVHASSLNVGPNSTLTFALDPVHNSSSLINVSGAATFAAGAKIGATLISTPSLAGQTFTVVQAGSLSIGNQSSALLANLPYLFVGSTSVNSAANSVSFTVRTKSTSDLGLNKSEAAAFNAVYAALPQDSGIQTAVISAPDRPTFISAYDQLLPNSSGDVFQTAFGMSRAVSRAASDRFDTSTQKDDEDEDDFIVSGFWASEFFSGVEQNKADNNAYHSAGLGVIGGYDFGGTGVTISASSANISRPHQPGDNLNSVSVVEGGLYADPRFGPLSIDARFGAAYLKIADRRQLVDSIVSGDLSTTSTLTRTARGDWNGYDLTGHLGAALQLDVTPHLFFQPRVYGDVLSVHENAYSERGGGTGYDFLVSQRNGAQSDGTVSLVSGLRYGSQFIISPQFELGYDKVITGGPGDTTARFAYGGPSFTVAPNQMGGAAVARLTLRGDGNYVHFSLQAGGEYSSSYHSVDMKAVFRLAF